LPMGFVFQAPALAHEAFFKLQLLRASRVVGRAPALSKPTVKDEVTTRFG
jgi:hypothetical protein